MSNFIGTHSFIPDNAWILDSSATHHVCHDINFFDSFDDNMTATYVMLPTGHNASISKTGTIRLNDSLILTRELYVPSFRYNLTFVSSLTSSLSCSLIFYADKCLIQDTIQGKKIGMSKRFGNLYFLDLVESK